VERCRPRLAEMPRGHPALDACLESQIVQGLSMGISYGEVLLVMQRRHKIDPGHYSRASMSMMLVSLDAANLTAFIDLPASQK
jgi:hypothetical protein